MLVDLKLDYWAIASVFDDRWRMRFIRLGNACIHVICANFGAQLEVGDGKVEGVLLYDFIRITKNNIKMDQIRWEGLRNSTQNCGDGGDRSFALSKMLQSNGHRRTPKTWLAVERPTDSPVRNGCEQKLIEKLRTPKSNKVDYQWDQMKRAMHLAADFDCCPRPGVYKNTGSRKSR